MKKPKNLKTIIISALLALLITLILVILAMFKISNIECTVQYLNPWQLFFECGLFYAWNYAIVFPVCFLVICFGLMINKKFYD